MRELHDIKAHKENHHKNDENIIEINNMDFSYTSLKEKKHLNDVSIGIKKGQWTTIIGPNGSGKSTLAKAIVGINKIKNGQIMVDKKNQKNYKKKQFAKKIAYIPQTIEIPNGIKVYDFVAFGRNPHLNFLGGLSNNDHEIIKKAMGKMKITNLKDLYMDELSGGLRQKAIVAMIYAQQTDIIILDEPTTYLDIRNQYELLELLDELHHDGKTIISILHDINQAIQYSDYIFVMKEGKILVRGTQDKVITKKNLKNIYGIDAKIYEMNKRKYLIDIKLV